MFNGKMKAVTFSYDDGVVQDRRFIELLDKYGLKCTFNINTELTHLDNRLKLDEISELYKNHELAVHTLTHPNLNELPNDDAIIHEVEQDRKNIEKITGYPVYGMAYPNGTSAINDHVVEVLRENTAIKYARTTTSTYNFDVQKDLIQFNPTIHHSEWEKMTEMAKKFIEMKPESPQIFYIWGHTYEFDFDDGIYWEKIEEFFKLISGHDDIFYGTNSEVLL